MYPVQTLPVYDISLVVLCLYTDKLHSNLKS